MEHSVHVVRYFWITKFNNCTNYFNIPDDDQRLHLVYKLLPVFRETDKKFREIRASIDFYFTHRAFCLFTASLMMCDEWSVVNQVFAKLKTTWLDMAITEILKYNPYCKRERVIQLFKNYERLNECLQYGLKELLN